MKDFADKVCMCALNTVMGYNPVEGRKLVDWFGTAEAVFGASPEEIDECVPGNRALTEQIGVSALEKAEKDLGKAAACGARFITQEDDDYPSLLLECPDAPLGIFFRSVSSPSEVFEMRTGVAVVGTRDLSPYGKEWTRKLTLALTETETPPVVVSGLAFGADIIAHEAALERGVPTVGVMATGVDTVYPWQHSRTAEKMATTPLCALVTDYPPGTAPVALNFMRRNRIIAGLSRAVIVTESRKKGGSLLTARYANEYCRDVYALPGKADDVRSEGCNSLIRFSMAEIITDPYDLVGRIGLKLPRRGKSPVFRDIVRRTYALHPDVEQIVACAELISANRGINADELCRNMGLPYASVASLTATLEGDGFVKADLLGRYSIIAR